MVITVFLSGTDIELMFEGEHVTIDNVIDKLVSDDIICLWSRYDYLSPNPYTYQRYEEDNNSSYDREELRQDVKNHIMLSKMDRYHILSINDFIYHEDRLYGICTL